MFDVTCDPRLRVFVDLARHCPRCEVGWCGAAGDTCWCCPQEGVNGLLNISPNAYRERPET